MVIMILILLILKDFMFVLNDIFKMTIENE